jgi:3'(2'), 5'-bisphosphate nucleotidase
VPEVDVQSAPVDPAADLALALDLARVAGERLLALRAEWPAGEPGGGAAGDRAAQKVLAAGLSAARPADAVLSEEALDLPGRDRADRVWIIDPLDGTREFAEGRDDWAVHVALWERAADGLTAGAVALPGRGLVLGSADIAVPRRAPGPLRIAVSRTRPPAAAVAVAEELGAELIPMGSAGAKVAAVVLGEVDAYVHAGGQYQWDSAAPVAVALAAGLRATRLDGSRLRYNDPDPALPDLLVARTEYFDAVLAAANRKTDR